MWFQRQASQAVATMVLGLSSFVFGAGSVVHVDDDAPPGGDGASWDTAYRFLQDGLTSAAKGRVNEIRVAQGTYKPDRDEANPDGTGDREATFQLINDVALIGGYAGFGAKNPDAHDIELYETILSGDLLGDDEPGFVNIQENSYHVVTGSDTDVTAILDGFAITGGNANGTSEDSTNQGGGMYNAISSPTVTGCSFIANLAISFGGGMFNEDESNPTVTYCTFGGNQASAGGGMANYQSKPVVTESTFISNTSTIEVVFGGGGMFNIDCNPVVANCTFETNVAVNGGGILNFVASPSITNCTFVRNSAFGGGYSRGGGVYNNAFSSPKVTSCTFNGNYVDWWGAAMLNANGSSPQITNCVFSGNRADLDCGGIFNLEESSPTISNCTITANEADYGGGIVSYMGSYPVLFNCIVWANVGVNGQIVGEPANVAYTCVQDGYPGIGNIDSDPIFVRNPDPGPDGVWGTEDDDYGDLRLAAGSPCVDAGNNWGMTKDEFDYDEDGILCELFPVDLDGSPRFNADEADFDPGCGVPVVVDMGAYEYQFDPAGNVIFADLNADGTVAGVDLLGLLASWGPCGKGCCLADLDIDGNVGASDLLAMLTNWGPCP
ncbi:MAG: right-handed parallel beta-helix repeat-containing protein [Phycisphaerales bacterium]